MAIHVEVKFKMDADDPEHSSGLSDERYLEVEALVTGLGYDIEIEKVETDEGKWTPSTRRKKERPGR